MKITLPHIVNVGTFLFFALSLIVKGGYNYGVGILFLTAIFTFPHWWPKRPRQHDLLRLSLGFIMMGSVALVDVWLSGLRDTFYNTPIKYICTPLLLYFLATYPPHPRAIWWGAACGALLGLLSAWYYSHFAPELLPNGRAARYLHPIQLGNLAMLFTLLCACNLRGKTRGWGLLFPLIGISTGIYTVLLSETRGSFFALGWTLFFLAILSLRRRHFKIRSISIASTLAVLLIALFWLGNMEIIEERLAEAKHDITLYQQGDANTSIGARFEMWRFAWQEGKNHLLFGSGTAQMNIDKAAWSSHAFLSQFGHLHNEFLDAFARRGLLGLGIILYIFLLPLYLYRKTKVRNNKEAAALRLAGCAHILLYSGFSLTQAALYSHNSGFLFFAVPLCMIYGALCNFSENRGNSDHV